MARAPRRGSLTHSDRAALLSRSVIDSASVPCDRPIVGELPTFG